MIVFLDPDGIQNAYSNQVVEDMSVLDKLTSDIHKFYTRYQIPNSDGNKRHVSQKIFLSQNSHLKHWECGSDHYGNWHATGHEKISPIITTSDCFQ